MASFYCRQLQFSTVLVNGTGPCVERRVEERAALAWCALAARRSRAGGVPRSLV